MLSAFFRSLPRELEEAAFIDGCNVYSAFFRIIIPSVRPAIATQIVLISINTWNEFFIAFIIGARDGIRPLPVALLNFFTSIGVSDWGQIGAVMILASIPTALIYIIGYKQIEKALTAGSILK
jgi:raffinose/stachyose/melibiose transport system permease protein